MWYTISLFEEFKSILKTNNPIELNRSNDENDINKFCSKKYTSKYQYDITKPHIDKSVAYNNIYLPLSY